MVAEKAIDELSAKIATGDSKYSRGHIGHLFIFAERIKPEAIKENGPSYDIERAVQRSRMIDPNKTKRGM